MYNNEFRTVVEELVATKNKLAQAEQELKICQQKRSRKSEPSPDKDFNDVRAKIRAKMRYQEDRSPDLYKRVILKTLLSGNYSVPEFFQKTNKGIEQLLGYKPFVDTCMALRLNPYNVAWHVVMSGEKNMNKVFKHGLVETFDSKLVTMKQSIFSREEVQSLSESAPIIEAKKIVKAVSEEDSGKSDDTEETEGSDDERTSDPTDLRKHQLTKGDVERILGEVRTNTEEPK